MLHPDDAGLLLVRSLWGLPVELSPEVDRNTVRFGCGGSAWKIDEEIAASGILGEFGIDDHPEE